MTRPMSDAEFEMMLKRGDEAMTENAVAQDVKFVVEKEKDADPFSRQVGGSHYKQYKIQPYEFFYKNNIPHHKSAIIRRILRYDHPTGKGLTDLDKIIHEVELIKKLWLEEQEGKDATSPDPKKLF